MLKKITKTQGKRKREEEKDKEELQNSQKTMNRMAISTYLSIITLNVNGLNSPIKIHGVAKWIRNKTNLYAASKRLTSEEKTHTV